MSDRHCESCRHRKNGECSKWDCEYEPMRTMTREEAIERFKGIRGAMSISVAQGKYYDSKAELNELCDMAIEALSEPSIVRCKHCKHWNEWENGTGSCHRSENRYNWFGVDYDDYCSFGERKSDG